MTNPERIAVQLADDGQKPAELATSDGATEVARPHSVLFGSKPEPAPAAPSFGLRKVVSLPGWRWGKLAAARAELEEARGLIAALDLQVAAHVDAARALKAGHASDVEQLSAQAEQRLEDTRQDAAKALELLRIELEARSVDAVEAAIRAAYEDANQAASDMSAQHAVALEALRTELARANAKALALEEELPVRVEAVRREAETAHDAAVWALTARSATLLEAARRDTAAALAAQATRLETQAAGDLAAAKRAFQGEAAQALAQTAKQHNAAIAAVRADLATVEARRARLEQDLPAAVDRARRQEQAAHASQVATLEAQAAAQLDSTRRDADTALATLAQELESKYSAHLDVTLRSVRDEAGRAAAETAQQHTSAMAAIRATLEQTEARRATLEHDLPARVEAARRETAMAHATELAALRIHAASQVESAVRDARDEAARAMADLARRHEAELAALRAEREAIEARGSRLAQELDVEVTRRRETALAHAAALAAQQTQADARLEAVMRDAHDEATRVATETAQQHATALAAVRADLDVVEARRAALAHDLPAHVEAARREGAAAHAAEIAALRAQAAAQVEAAIRDVRDEAARTAADTAVRHAAALAAVRHELDEAEGRRVRLDQDLAVQAVLRREAGIAHAVQIETLHTQAAVQVDAALNDARAEAAREAAELAGRHAVALAALRAELDESESRRATLERDLPIQVDAARRDAEAAHEAAVTALRAQATAQVETAVRDVRDEWARATVATPALHDVAVSAVRVRHETPDVERIPALAGVDVDAAARQRATARQMVVVTGALVLAGLAGSLVAWSVAFWGVLY